MAHKYPRLNAFEMLPEAAKPLVQKAVDSVVDRRATQTEAFVSLCASLKEQGLVADEDIPGFSSFNRLLLRKLHRKAGAATAGVASTVSVSLSTKTLLAAALRSLADDLDAADQDDLSVEIGLAVARILGVHRD